MFTFDNKVNKHYYIFRIRSSFQVSTNHSSTYESKKCGVSTINSD
jgi:hypothetical protein